MNRILSPVLEYARSYEADRTPTWHKCAGKRVDMHCHSTFSDETLRWVPGLVYHPMLTPEQTYDLAKSRGMDFVTLTDHDTIDGCKDLLDRRGDLRDFIVGEEVSVAFPEDGTIVHVNVYDHDEEQHREIQRLRGNMYELVAYLRQIDKLYVINHLTWTEQHRVLKPWQIEAMLDLFPAFEGLNGTRSYAHNAFAWYATRGHDKTLVAGSDSHTNRVGTTYTLTAGETRAEVLGNIRAGHTAMCGAFGTPEKLADDVRLVMQGELERRLAQAGS
ncbi:MAG: hypothetical protein JXO22_08030, partial [Phycisphaerae bacterium]|nr:hypothetical protein [Phycisphaerae bacterium]